MALTLTTDLIPYENQFRQGYIDAMVEAANVFNENSRGTIRFQDSDAAGLKNKMAYFKDFGTVTRRDITSVADQTPEKIVRAEHSNFRTYFKLNALEWQDEAFETADKMGKDAIMYMVGGQLAKKKLAESISQAISITVAAIESNGAKTVLDLTKPTATNFLQPQINKARMKFGDQFTRLKVMVMHSSVFFCLAQNQTLNYQYDMGGGITLYGGIPGTLGMPFIVCDNAGLMYTEPESEDIRYRTLLLTDEAVTVGDAGNIRALLTTVGGKENISHIYQAEWSMWNNVKGYELKPSSNPDGNPADSVLSNPSNWKQWTADVKNTAGILVKSDANLDTVTQVINTHAIA